MKRMISMVLAVVLLFTCVLAGIPTAHASAKAEEPRAIAIVFDNSGSMYMEGTPAWCRATYAMEVFASMLNAGDILQIYPMHPILVGGSEYTMENPFQITDAAQASMIREIYTEDAGGTPIESIDCAAEGLKGLRYNKKYMIVLTDGGTFTKNENGLTKERTIKELDNRIQDYAGKEMAVMYLGIGSSACIPSTEPSEYFAKAHAVNSEDVLSTLTEMCNLIFGRDTLPKNHISGDAMEFDISMKKLIVFVQGEDIADLKITGSGVGQMVSSQQTRYATDACGDYTAVPDTSLQGMMVTYTDCAAGSYTIDYTGTATSVEVYYEPDADLDFIFTDAAGNNVEPNTLYEGEYKVSFGMKDARTGQLIASDLLGNPHYQGSYSVSGQEVTIEHEGHSGEVPVTLHMNDTFDANLTVTYLSGYTISKNAKDFGWPAGGIQIQVRPAGELRLEITGGDESYPLQTLEEGAPYIAKVYYEGKQLTGSELETVDLRWEPETSNAEIKEAFADDHINLRLFYKDPVSPQDTVCGECTVAIYAHYTAPGSSPAEGQSPLTYNIVDDFTPLELELEIPESYILIRDLETSREIVASLKYNGEPLTSEQFAAAKVEVDCGRIEHTVTASEQDSAYLIKLLPTEDIGEGIFRIKVSAELADRIGRITQAEDSGMVTLSHVPLWVRWMIRLALLLLAAILLWTILRIRVLPNRVHTTKKLSSLNFDGDDVTQNSNFAAEIKKGSAKMHTQYAGKKFGVVMDVKPGKESFLYKSQKKRSAEVKVPSVRKFGNAVIQEVLIGSTKYVADENSGKLVPAQANQKPFELRHGMMVRYSGKINDAGVDKDFEATTKLDFKK